MPGSAYVYHALQRTRWCKEERPMMTATQLATHWKVHSTTVGRAIIKAHLPKARGVTYTDEQVAQIRACLPSLQPKNQAKAHRAPRPAPPRTPQAPSGEDPLSKRVALLEAQVALQQRHIAQLDQRLQKTIAWGRNTARIIRTLWHRMPDYQQGETPGEFPAITAPLLDEEGQEAMNMMAEEAQRTEAFFAESDQQHRTSIQEEEH